MTLCVAHVMVRHRLGTVMTTRGRLLCVSDLCCASGEHPHVRPLCLLPMAPWGTLPCVGDVVSEGGTLYLGVLRLPPPVAGCATQFAAASVCLLICRSSIDSIEPRLGHPYPLFD